MKQEKGIYKWTNSKIAQGEELEKFHPIEYHCCIAHDDSSNIFTKVYAAFGATFSNSLVNQLTNRVLAEDNDEIHNSLIESILSFPPIYFLCAALSWI